MLYCGVVSYHLCELSTITALSIEYVSRGNPVMFHAWIFIGSPRVLVRLKSSEQGISLFCTAPNGHTVNPFTCAQCYAIIILMYIVDLSRAFSFQLSLQLLVVLIWLNDWLVNWLIADCLADWLIYHNDDYVDYSRVTANPVLYKWTNSQNAMVCFGYGINDFVSASVVWHFMHAKTVTCRASGLFVTSFVIRRMAKRKGKEEEGEEDIYFDRNNTIHTPYVKKS